MKEKLPVNFAQGANSLFLPAACLDQVVQAYLECKRIIETETTKRREIEAWEKTKLAEIQAQRDLLIGYLERSFDERSQNFKSLFQLADQALANGDNQQLVLTLDSIINLAKDSPFKDLVDLAAVKNCLADQNHVWEI
jgi:ribonucleotide reductase alpha subunit